MPNNHCLGVTGSRPYRALNATTQTSPTTISIAKTSAPGFAFVLQRERLFSRLDEGAPVNWISGAAGTGKSMLAASWLSERERESLWYRVDPEDTSGEVFSFYLEQAAARHLGQRYRPPSDPVGSRDISAAHARGYFRHLFGLFKKPFALVLDNFQDAHPGAGFAGLLDDAITEVPGRGRIVVISRSEPPAELAHHRAAGRIHLITADELRFTEPEIQALAALRGQTVAKQVIADLHRRSDGWAAGLVLMLEYLRRTALPSADRSPATPQVIFDWFAGEVFRGFEPDMQGFLLQIQCLRQVTASLAEALTGKGNARSLLVNLSLNNFFVSEIPSRPEPVYQFHPLFHEFLHNKADHQFGPPRIKALRERAATLLAEDEQFEDALSQFGQAGCWEKYASLLNRQAPQLVEQGRVVALAGWLDAYPAEHMAADAWLNYWSGICHLADSPREARLNFEHAAKLFEDQVKEGIGDAAVGRVLGYGGVLQAILDEMDDLSQADRWLRQLTKHLNQATGVLSDRQGEELLATMISTATLRGTQTERLAHWREQADQRVRIQHGPAKLALALTLADLAIGNVVGASSRLQLLDPAANGPPTGPDMLAMLRTAPAVFSGGEDGCRQAVELVDEPPPPGADIWPLVMAIVGHLELGNTERAEALLDGLQQPRSGRLELSLAHYLAGWLELLRNNPDKAFLQQKAALVYAVEIGIPVLEAMCHLALALTLVHWHDAQQSAAHIDQARQRLQGLRAPFVEFLGTLVNAFRDHIVQRPAERDRQLQAALRIGREHGYTLLPGWTPQMLAPICIRALQAGYETGYVRSLIRAKNLRPAEPPLRVVAWPWRLRISTLGTFDIVVDDVPLVSSGKGRHKPVELLKTLIGLGGESVSAMQIATILWPNVDEGYAFKNYTINLHRLRKLLGDDGALIQREGRLSLDPASAWLDCRAVLATAKEIEQLSRAAREQKHSTRIIALAAELLAVYRGTFLADEADSTVYQQQRQRMREVLQQSILPLGRYWEEAGEWERAVDIYRQALKRERTAGPLYVQLLACYRRLDRRADALAAYEACRVNLDPQQFERLFGVLEKALGDWLQ